MDVRLSSVVLMLSTKLRGGVCTILIEASCNYTVAVLILNIDLSPRLILKIQQKLLLLGFQKKLEPCKALSHETARNLINATFHLLQVKNY